MTSGKDYQTDSKVSSPSIIKEVLAGLSRSQKSLPAKLLYDKRGSEIFERICLLEEYYPTRAETEILKNNASEICHLIGSEALIIEPGSGAGEKIRYLLPHLIKPQAYVPIEISQEILLRMEIELKEEFPQLKVQSICADFNEEFEIPLALEAGARKKAVFFPGSTIGNFTPQEAVPFLKKIASLVGQKGGLVIGVDLKKDPEILKRAYNDSQGVTANFNMNLLERLNRDASAEFNLSKFEHQAVYDEKEGRVEMHIVSKMSQSVKIHESIFRFKEGESIHTENSYKYTEKEFSDLCKKAKLKIKRTWKDHKELFCVYYFEKF